MKFRKTVFQRWYKSKCDRIILYLSFWLFGDMFYYIIRYFSKTRKQFARYTRYRGHRGFQFFFSIFIETEQFRTVII